MTLLSIENLSVGYNEIPALQSVSLTVNEGEVVSILGANGAGKSTLLRTISGVERGTGTIRFRGESIERLEPDEVVRRGIVHVPEGRQVFPGLTVAENLEMGAFLRRDSAQIRREMDRVYTTFPRLEERKRQYAGSLSGGEQQMLAVGRALMANPRVIMLDEPSMGLAPVVVEQVFEVIRQVNQEGRTVILAEQNSALSLAISQRAYVLVQGRVYAEGTVAELREGGLLRQAYLGGRKAE